MDKNEITLLFDVLWLFIEALKQHTSRVHILKQNCSVGVAIAWSCEQYKRLFPSGPPFRIDIVCWNFVSTYPLYLFIHAPNFSGIDALCAELWRLLVPDFARSCRMWCVCASECSAINVHQSIRHVGFLYKCLLRMGTFDNPVCEEFGPLIACFENHQWRCAKRLCQDFTTQFSNHFYMLRLKKDDNEGCIFAQKMYFYSNVPHSSQKKTVCPFAFMFGFTSLSFLGIGKHLCLSCLKFTGGSVSKSWICLLRQT